MANAPKTTPPPPPVASTKEKKRGVGGYAIRLFAFIPIPKNNIRTQTEMGALVMDVQDGKRPFSDLMPFLKEMEYDVNFINKQFSESEIAAWTKKPTEEKKDDEGDQQDGMTHAKSGGEADPE